MVEKKQIINIKIWEIIMSIFIIGIINLYMININGLEVILPIIENIEKKEIWESLNCGGIIKINEINLLMIIIINMIFYIIFNSSYHKFIKESWGINSLEFIYLLSFGLLGLNIIILSNDLIFIFIALELYSLSVYLLILNNITKNSSRLSIIYLLINSISSYIFLLGIAIIYKNTGSIILEEINYILNNNNNNIGIMLLIISLLIKLGTVPFNFWVLRLYTTLENRILLYQIIIPKIVYLFLLYKILNYILPMNNIEYLNMIFILIYIIALLSVIVGSIGGLFNTNFKAILTYSSIFNMGFILLGILNNINNMETKNTFIEYILIYSLNTLVIFICFLLINPESTFYKNKKINYNIYKIYPLFSIFLLISIFSFIGIPPFAGFYAKLNIFINILQSINNKIWEWGIVSIIILLIGTFISSCFYLKFVLNFFIKGEKFDNKKENLLISEKPLSISYIYSFLVIFLIMYPFIMNYLNPYYLIIFN